jgi:hypothetical protein
MATSASANRAIGLDANLLPAADAQGTPGTAGPHRSHGPGPRRTRADQLLEAEHSRRAGCRPLTQGLAEGRDDITRCERARRHARHAGGHGVNPRREKTEIVTCAYASASTAMPEIQWHGTVPVATCTPSPSLVPSSAPEWCQQPRSARFSSKAARTAWFQLPRPVIPHVSGHVSCHLAKRPVTNRPCQNKQQQRWR